MAGGERQYVSVVLSGGVSLGAYFSGVVAQLGFFVARWNEQELKGEKRFIHLDVVSGASAGALTGAMLTRFVTRRMDEPEGFVRACYDAWCSLQLSLERLTRVEEGTLSFFSNQAVLDLADRYLPHTGDDEFAFGQDHLVYTCTTTAINAIEFNIKLPGATAPVNRFSRVNETVDIEGKTRRDWVTFWFTPSGNRGEVELREDMGRVKMEEGWNRLKWIAMASGAFPLAWKPVNYPRWADLYSPGQAGSVSMNYMDGGVIDNMPFGRAAEAVVDFARESNDPELVSSRTYVLIDYTPAGETPKESLMPTEELANPGRDEQGKLATQLGALMEAINEQSLYMDLRGAARIDKRLEERAELVWPLLLSVIQAAYASNVSLSGDVTAKTSALLASRNVDSEKEGEKSELYQKRADINVFLDKNEVTDPNIRDEFSHWAYLIDLTANLDEKHRLRVLNIRPKQRLWSNFAMNFGGFFDQSLMALDFVTGMQTAKEELKKYVNALGWGVPGDELFATWETLNEPGDPPKEPSKLPEGVKDVANSDEAMAMVTERTAGFVDLNLPKSPWKLVVVSVLNGMIYGYVAIAGFVLSGLGAWVASRVENKTALFAIAFLSGAFLVVGIAGVLFGLRAWSRRKKKTATQP